MLALVVAGRWPFLSVLIYKMYIEGSLLYTCRIVFVGFAYNCIVVYKNGSTPNRKSRSEVLTSTRVLRPPHGAGPASHTLDRVSNAPAVHRRISSSLSFAVVDM